MNQTSFADLLIAPIGARITFASEKKPYRIRARSGRFLVCTKPFALQKTVIYTIIDLVERVRGPEDLVFGMGAESDQDCWNMIDRLDGRDANHPQGRDAQDEAVFKKEMKNKGLKSTWSRSPRTEVSHRRRIPLDVVKVDVPKDCQLF